MGKSADLRDKSLEDLRDDENKLAEQLFKYRMELATGQLSNTQVIKETKKNLARVKTVIREMELNIR
jgi:large subunit ribosomal protein L29